MTIPQTVENVGVLQTRDRTVRFIEDIDDVLMNIRELSAAGMVEAATASRIEKDLRDVVRALVAERLH